MRSLTLLSLLVSTLPTTLADVEFTKPVGGATMAAGAIAFAWKDNGESPSISDLVSYQIDLMVGGDTDATSTPIVNLVPGGSLFASGVSSGQGVVNPAQCGSQTNAYYLRITSVATAGGQTINFSPRFTITGMTGSFPANTLASLASPITDTSARAGVNQVAVAAAPAGAAQFSVPYNEQTGPTRYAPMMQQPPTTIIATNTAPLFPTSSVSIATTFLPPAALVGSIVTTLTQSNTFSVSQRENQASAASNPASASANDMQKFLNRWKD